MKPEPSTDDLVTTRRLQHAVEIGRPMMVPGTMEPRRLARPPDEMPIDALAPPALAATTILTPVPVQDTTDPNLRADPWLRQHPSVLDPLQLALEHGTEWFIRLLKGRPAA